MRESYQGWSMVNHESHEPNRRMQSFTAKFDHFVLAIEGESIDNLLYVN